MSDTDQGRDPMSHPKAWQSVAGQPGWFVLMDHVGGYRNPRLVRSDQDEYFIRETARGLFPGDKFKTITDDKTKKKFFVRQPKA